MKKNVFYLMLVLLTLFTTVSVIDLNAQVTIGENTAPHPGAVLELRGDKGLLLPRVSLDDAGVFQLATEKKDEAIGMLVYNLSNKKENGLKGEGIYVWNSQAWTLVAKSERNILVSEVEIAAENNVKTVAPGGTLKILADIKPANATNKGLNWSVSAGSIDAATGTFTAGGTTGNVTISAQTVDGSNITSNVITIEIKAASNTVQGQNGEYAIHTFGTAGTWMVENSKEGTGYAGNNATGEAMSGLYYTSTQIAAACPTSGYAIPTLSQWNDLKAYLASSSATAEEKMMWLGTPRTGFFASGTNIHTSPGYSYWWISDNSNVFSVSPSNEIKVENGGAHKFTVRCIKQ